MAQLILSTSAAPATPAAGYMVVYAKADGLLYTKDAAGVEKAYANLNGDPSQAFSVAPATTGTRAPQANQMIGRNLIVNGSCQVDQVQSGVIISPMVAGSYVVDNFTYFQSQTGKLSGQQITTSLNSLGATNAIRFTVLSQFTPAAGDYFNSLFRVEGLNCAHLGWGTANAAPVSVQFKARSSVAGTYSGAIQNINGTRSYIFSFTLAANTDTLVKIENIPGDTSGTWAIDNTGVLSLSFSMGTGSTYAATTGSWLAGNYFNATGALNLVSQVNGSTLDIADVQLEKGAFCTTFERKLYDQVLRECRRYARKGSVYVPATTAQNLATIDMRATPTITGGGAGFTSTGTSADSLIAFQTTSGVQSLLLESRL